MSSGNTQFFLPQRSWQRGQSGRNAVRPDLFKNVLRFMQVQILLAQGEGLPTIPPPLPVLTVRPLASACFPATGSSFRTGWRDALYNPGRQ